jgi:hypothetical protein
LDPKSKEGLRAPGLEQVAGLLERGEVAEVGLTA